jgi:hypothetical protein
MKNTHNAEQHVKIIGANGQLSLGKAYAGKMVLVEHTDADTWIIKAGTFIPDSEKWLHTKENIAKLERALAWDKKNPARDNFAEVVRKLKK